MLSEKEKYPIHSRSKHPNNKVKGNVWFNAYEFFEEEYRLYGLTRQEYHAIRKANSPKCPHCGTPDGYAMGTGDCGCDVDPD